MQNLGSSCLLRNSNGALILTSRLLDEKEVETLDLAARLADDYSLNHKPPLETSHFLGNHITLNQIYTRQENIPLSQNHIPLSQVQMQPK